MAGITHRTLCSEEIINRMAKDHPHVFSFVGLVRDNAFGRRVLYLEYEAYKDMAEKKLDEICAEVRQRWNCDLEIVHRVGRIEIGETVVVIAVGADAYLQAMDGCRYAIDRIKEVVPIWKKEYFADGSVWVGRQAG